MNNDIYVIDQKKIQKVKTKNSKINGKNEENRPKFRRVFVFLRRKFNIRITEIQEQNTEILSKASNLDKAKQRLQAELDKVSGDVEKVEKRNI